MKKLLTLLLLAGFTSGCFQATFVRDVPGAPEIKEEVLPFWFWGLVRKHTVDVSTLCEGSAVRRVRLAGNFGTGLVTAVTLGIYSPRKVYVTCENRLAQRPMQPLMPAPPTAPEAPDNTEAPAKKEAK